MPESARATVLKPLTRPIIPPRDREPVVHLTIDNKTTACGLPVSALVSFRAFSEHPCTCCVKEKLKT